MSDITIERGKGAFARASAYWFEGLKPDESMTSRELCELLEIGQGRENAKDRSRVGSFLSTGLVKGYAAIDGKDAHGLAIYRRLHYPRIDGELDTIGELDVTPGQDIRPKEEHICFQCNKNFTATQVGEGILALFGKLDKMLKVAGRKTGELADDCRMHVQEIKDLKQLVDDKDKKILQLNNAIAEGTKGMDLHALAKFRDHLPKNAGGAA